MRILVLEDDDVRISQFQSKLVGNRLCFVKTAREAIECLDSETWDAVCLDHDLGGEVMVASGPGTGYEVACWLEEHPEKCPGRVFIHSFNPSGRDKMKAAVKMAVVCPGLWACDDPGGVISGHLKHTIPEL